MEPTESVIATRIGRIGRITLNRPRALNALDVTMIRTITAALRGWQHEPLVHAIVIEGAGDRAFCAGGDIRAIRQFQIEGRKDAVEAFFAEEYALNLLIATYPKPYIALVDGICMGGGIGVSVHGSYRVASEYALFAMPETAIGFFPDIGATYVLPRLPGFLGTYLALTGARMQGADAVHAGLATHFVPRAALAELSAALERDGVAALGPRAALLPAFSLAPNRELIDAAFSADTMPEILQRLEADGGSFARETVATLRTMSPSSLVWSLRLLRLGADRSLEACLAAELRATRRVTGGSEFIEGVRSMVVDKDRTPAWRPARVEDVHRADAEAMLGN